MRANIHPDYQPEVDHLKRTLEQIKIWSNALAKRETLARTEIEEILSQMADAKKPEDMTTSQLLEIERLQSSLSRRATLELASKDPYFGRLDVTLLDYIFNHNLTFEKIASAESLGGEHVSTSEQQTIYLGKVGVGDENGQSQLVVDWRAPIADLYYAGIHGPTSFEGPYGPINVDLHLLRRLLIKDSQLVDISDQEEASGIDDFLLTRLRENAGTGMKDIISTIQQNQNEIIRMPAGQPVIVQGSAGSGKTSVALHRVSYLLYIRRKEIFPEDTLILTPSKLFFGYIASVMPDLDIKRCKQMTFTDLALRELVDENLKILSCNDWMNRYCDHSLAVLDDKQELEIQVLQTKGSLAMLAGIDRYVAYLESVILPPDDLCTASGSLLVSQEAMALRYQDLSFQTLEKRAVEMHKWLQKQVKKVVERERERIMSFYERRLEVVRRNWPARNKDKPNPAAIELLTKRDTAIVRFEEESVAALAEYRRRIPKKLSLMNLYADFYSDNIALKHYVPELSPEMAIAMTSGRRNGIRSNLTQEDLALILRLKELLHGLDTYFSLTVVDEAQDMNPAEFMMLRSFLKGAAALTAVGDLAQKIYPHRGMTEWTSLMDVMEDREIIYREMKRSYRSSSEIIALANQVLRDQKGVTIAEAVRETGELPYAVAVQGSSSKAFKDKIKAISKLISVWEKEELKSVAIMAKSPSFCKKIFRELSALYGDDIALLTSENDLYNRRIVVLPVHLAKGLEFDAAIVTDAEAMSYGTGITDRSLLYVALTRPLHHLAYLYADKITPFLDDVPSRLIQSL